MGKDAEWKIMMQIITANYHSKLSQQSRHTWNKINA